MDQVGLHDVRGHVWVVLVGWSSDHAVSHFETRGSNTRYEVCLERFVRRGGLILVDASNLIDAAMKCRPRTRVSQRGTQMQAI